MKNKKIFILVIGLLIINFAFINNTGMRYFASGDLTDALCHEPGVIKAFKILAYVIVVIKILAPILIIVTGISSGLKAIMTEDDGGTKKITKLIIEKVVVAAFIFFIPGIIGAVMKFVGNYDKTASKFTECGKCLTNIKECDSLLSKYDK